MYVRSFADANGDGTGDLAAARARLPYLAQLGVGALRFTLWHLSPLADGGYDVADYRTVDPAFRTLAEAEALLAEARELGLRTIVDIVPNHSGCRTPSASPATCAPTSCTPPSTSTSRPAPGTRPSCPRPST